MHVELMVLLGSILDDPPFHRSLVGRDRRRVVVVKNLRRLASTVMKNWFVFGFSEKYSLRVAVTVSLFNPPKSWWGPASATLAGGRVSSSDSLQLSTSFIVESARYGSSSPSGPVLMYFVTNWAL